jgi:hypothetical protein
MAGPTTEAVNEDVKILREDLHRIEISLSDRIGKVEVSLREDIHTVAREVAELRGEFKIVKLIIAATLGTVIAGMATTVWTVATISANAKSNDTRLDRIETAISKLAPANPK